MRPRDSMPKERQRFPIGARPRIGFGRPFLSGENQNSRSRGTRLVGGFLFLRGPANRCRRLFPRFDVFRNRLTFPLCRASQAGLWLGGKESNKAVSNAAIARGLNWKSSGEGFTKRSDGSIIPVGSEEDVFLIVDLPFLPLEESL